MGNQALIKEIVEQPITTFLVTFMSFIWFYLNQYIIPVENVSFCYESKI